MFPPQRPQMSADTSGFAGGLGASPQGPPGMPMQAGPAAPPSFAAGLGADPSQMGGPPQIDPQLVQLLLLQMQADGLEGGMTPEAQVMQPQDPMAGMMGLSTQMPGSVPGMGMQAGVGGMGGPGMPGGNLPPAFAQAQMLAQSRPQSAGY